MTQTSFRASGPLGFVAIYDGPQNDALAENPSLDPSKIRYHSSWDIPGSQLVRKTFTIPAVTGGYFGMERVNLGPHGKPFTPIVQVKLRGWLNGDGTPVDLPLAGGVLLDFYGQRPGDSGVLLYRAPASHSDRWSRPGPTHPRSTSFDNGWVQKSLLLGAGADGNNLFLWYEQVVNDTGPDANYPAFPLTVDFLVGDRSVDALTGDASSILFQDLNTGVVLGANRITATGTTQAAFDTRTNQYAYRNDATPDVSYPLDDAVLFDDGVSGANGYRRFVLDYAPNWRFDLTEWVSGSPTVPVAAEPGRVGLSFYKGF